MKKPNGAIPPFPLKPRSFVGMERGPLGLILEEERSLIDRKKFRLTKKQAKEIVKPEGR